MPLLFQETNFLLNLWQNEIEVLGKIVQEQNIGKNAKYIAKCFRTGRYLLDKVLQPLQSDSLKKYGCAFYCSFGHVCTIINTVAF